MTGRRAVVTGWMGAAGCWSVAVLALVGLAGCQQPAAVVCPGTGRICPRDFYCAAHQDICIPVSILCGNGVMDPGEKCDDGNTVNDDGCNSKCTSNNECGNGIIDKTFDNPALNESCDDGKELNGMPMHCSADCKSTGECGNGIRDNGEECDYCEMPEAGADAAQADVDANASDAASDAPAGSDAASAAEGGMSVDGGDGSADALINPRSLCGLFESKICNSDCTTFKCGDRKVNKTAGEECDEGGETATCNGDCTLARCGDAKVNGRAGEQCDVAGAPDTANCNGAAGASLGVACRFATCGDGYVNAAAHEECDSSSGADATDCNGQLAPPGAACRHSQCGDGYINAAAGETCDTLGGADTALCNGKNAPAGVACHAAQCGDGYVNAAAGETCEVPTDGSNTPSCNGIAAGDALKCKPATCGDGYINAAAGEICEVQSSGADTVACNGMTAPVALRCKPATCGDGYINGTAGETCEVTASGADTGGCNGLLAGMTLRCKAASCGDGYINGAAGETCEVVNGADSNGCNGFASGTTLRCKGPVCGDGYINTSAGEECDDKNGVSGDGCSSACKKEPGFTCTAAGVGCTPNCGDGTKLGTEACDDGNTDVCGTCNSTCTSAQTPVRATGVITTTGSDKIKNGDTLTVSDGLHPKVVFEFNASQTLTDASRVRISLGNNPDGPAMATRIANAISSATTFSAVRNNNINPKIQVLLTSGNPGRGGNVGLETTVTDSGFMLSGMLGGVGYDCAAGVGCVSAKDCTSGVCCLAPGCTSAPNKCLAPTCSDGVTNATESDMDCGGSGTPTCPRCANGKACLTKDDCVSGLCDSANTGLCQDSCNDNLLDGHETDVDCGGICGGCPKGSDCKVDADCTSGNCGVPAIDAGVIDGGPVDAGVLTPRCL